MNFEEHAAKPLLAPAGIPVPAGRWSATPRRRAAAAAARTLRRQGAGAAGKRGKAGGIRPAATPAEAEAAARAILGIEIGGHAGRKVLVEGRSRSRASSMPRC